jgi:hypothetical protein
MGADKKVEDVETEIMSDLINSLDSEYTVDVLLKI